MSLLLAATWLAAKDPTLRYFGYMNVDGQPKTGEKNYVAEIGRMTHANIVHFQAGDPAALGSYLEACRRDRIQAVVGVNWLFFSAFKAGGTGDGAAVLIADWRDRWTRFRQAAAGYENTIYAVAFEAPYWNGVDTVTFRSVTSFIRQDPAGFRILTLEHPGSFRSGQRPPVTSSYFENVTDAGLVSWRVAWARREFLPTVALLEDRLPMDARLFAVMECTSETEDVSNIQRSLINTLAAARSHPRFVGTLCDMYSPGALGIKTAARDFMTASPPGTKAQLRDQFLAEGRKITWQ